jgi:hypothetical protein
MRIVLFLDTSDGAASGLTHLRAGTIAFLDALSPDDEVMIVTTGRQVRVRTQRRQAGTVRPPAIGVRS